MLTCSNISFKRLNRFVLKNINFSVSEKNILHIKGNNGVGKTTLLKLISNILSPDSGQILWKGKNIKKNLYEFYSELTLIMDKATANENLTVYENIVFWKKLFSSSIKYDQIILIIDLLNLQKYKNSPVSHLSFGEIRKLELIRLMIEQKKVWVLDEPFIGLDKHSIEIINQTILNHVKRNGIVIFTSHFSPDIPDLKILNLENNDKF